MFGNKLGWGIAAALAMAVLGVVYMVASLDNISKPSQGALDKKGMYALKLVERPQMLDPISLPFNPITVLPTMNKSNDAAPAYRAAIAEYARDSSHYNPEYATRIKSTNLTDYPAFQELIKAKDSAAMSLFQAKPEEVINFSLTPEPIKALSDIGEMAIQVSMRMTDSQHDDALALAEAVYSLGAKLAAERIRYAELETGHQLMAKGSYQIGKLDPSRKSAGEAATAEMVKFMKERCIPLRYATSSIDPEVMGRTAGDMFYIVKNGKERMWRVEAMLKLGQYKYNSGEPGNAADQRWAKIIARRVMNDPNEDRIVKIAAKASYELTKDDYMGIGAN